MTNVKPLVLFAGSLTRHSGNDRSRRADKREAME